MRDGVHLCTDIFLPPEDSERATTVLLRTPYNRAQPFLLRLAMHLNQSGFAAALQDCRGRYKSEGELDWRLESADTKDTLAWIVDQAWSDGRVSLIGLSISSLGYFPLLAGDLPDGAQIPAVINIMGALDLHSLFYHQGALRLHWALPWLHIVHGKKEDKRWRQKPWRSLYREALSELPDDGSFDAEFWRFVRRHPEKSEEWKPYDGGSFLSRIETPMLHLSGWNDFMLGQTLSTYHGLTDQQTKQKGRQKLVIGPWDHANLLDGRKPGSVNDGGFDIEDLVVGWLERWTRPDAERSLAARSLASGSDVLLFVQGERRWVGFDSWPRSGSFQLFLAHSGDDARSGEGTLTPERPSTGEDTVLFDPESPVPTVGGPIWPFPAAGLKPGHGDQSAIEGRDDVLLYTSSVLDRPLTIAGAVEVELWQAAHPDAAAGAAAEPVDWSIRLTDVSPAGKSSVIASGHARLRSQSGATKVHVDARGLARVVPAGHRLRLDIAGSNFPQFDLPPGVETRRPQSLLRGGEHASVLRLSTLNPAQLRSRQLDPLRDVDRSFLGRTKMRLQTKAYEVISAQFGRPRGFLGHLTGWALARLNVVTNDFCLEQLAIEPDDQVLEIGFGPGWSIRRAAALAKNGRVYGIDVSKVMLKQARRRNSKAIRQGRVELRLGNVNDLPYKEPATFHKVYGVNSIQLWPKPIDNLRQVRQLMKAGAVISLALQPQWLRTEAQVRALGGQKLRLLRQAGFVGARLEIKRMAPVPAFCAVATNPEEAPAEIDRARLRVDRDIPQSLIPRSL